MVGTTAAAAFELPPGPKPTSPGHRRCGQKEPFRHQFLIEAQGIGCGQARTLLPGSDLSEVEDMLGIPDEREPEAHGTSLLVYSLGPERDSIFQIDPELLLIQSKGNLVTAISIEQA